MIKKFTLLTLTFLMLQHVSAQNQFKTPVKFKLKNNLTVIVAQNIGSGKIFSRLTVENEIKEEEKTITNLLEGFLRSKANNFNLRQAPDSRTVSQVTLTATEANTATSIFNFEQALSFVSLNLLDPELAQQVYAKMDSIYDGPLSDLKSLQVADIERYLADHLKTSDIYLTIAGDISPNDAKLMANRVFGDWHPKSTTLAE